MEAYLRGKVAAWTVHVWDWRPRSVLDTIFFATVHPSNSVKASKGENVTVISYYANPRPAVTHWAELSPLFCFRIEDFSRTKTFLAIESSTYIQQSYNTEYFKHEKSVNNCSI